MGVLLALSILFEFVPIITLPRPQQNALDALPATNVHWVGIQGYEWIRFLSHFYYPVSALAFFLCVVLFSGVGGIEVDASICALLISH